MLHGQSARELLPGLEQMPDIGAGEIPAGRALTARLDRPRIDRKALIRQMHDAAHREDRRVAGIAARHHAVKEVDAPRRRFDDILRRTDAHEIADLLLRHMRLDVLDDIIHHLGRLTDGQSADRIAVHIELRDLVHMRDAEIGEGAALIDAEQELMRIDRPILRIEPCHFGLAALQPARSALAAFLCVFIRRGILHAFIECHCDGRAEMRLNAHTLLRPHENASAVHMGAEGHALLLDLAELRERENLKSAGIGQCGAVPAGKALQAAHLPDDLIAGADMEMIGIAEHDLTADRFEVTGGECALDCTGGRDIHEARCLEVAVNGSEDAAAGGLFLFQQFKHTVFSFDFTVPSIIPQIPKKSKSAGPTAVMLKLRSRSQYQFAEYTLLFAAFVK